jgi:ferric-dicitrate binding protein FerR (iron transport regulator)
MLPDGSRVRLAPSSRLTVSKDFGSATRTTTLSGEAFFEVVRSAGAPFIVHSGSVATRVLGTKFDVRHYPGDKSVHIAVVSGKVVAHGATDDVTLTAGMVGHLADSGTTVESSAARSYVTWTEGRLEFDNVPAATMLAAVGQWYGYRFRFADSAMARRRFVATFQLSEREATMTEIRQLLGARMTIDGETITLYPRSGGSASPATPRADDESMLPKTEIGK